MMCLRNIRQSVALFVCTLLLASCAIKDDLPLPLVKAAITAFEVEGQCDAGDEAYAEAVIDNDKRTVDVYVNDLVDLTRLKIKCLKVSNDASVGVETAHGIVPLSDFTIYGKDTVMDFSDDVTFVLSTYQEYRWRVSVCQVVCREIVLQNQVGSAIIDTVNNNVIVYVAPDQDLRAVRVDRFALGGKHGTVSPDPTGTVVDFSVSRTYDVREYGSARAKRWRVFVYNADATQTVTASVFPHAVKAYVSGHKQSGTTPVVEYRRQTSAEWIALSQDNVQAGALDYTATITGLEPGAAYECRVTSGGKASPVCEFQTSEALQLPNAGFEDWSVATSGNRSLYQPWAEGGTPYWDTGNCGATTVGASNVTFATEGDRKFANLQSKFIVIKFAAGSIFTGTYVKTDGTNGILGFGRPFDSFPTKLQFDYTFKTSIVNRGGGKWDENYGRYISHEMYDNMRGKPDSCQIYIALMGDKDEEVIDGVTYPYVIRTRPSELKLFNPRSDNVIAYAQITIGDDVPQWTTETLTIDYRYKDRTPKYILVVASSSKYGDYFMGGDETLLRLDNVRLLYE